jgi:hypothetical protein
VKQHIVFKNIYWLLQMHIITCCATIIRYALGDINSPMV